MTNRNILDGEKQTRETESHLVSLIDQAFAKIANENKAGFNDNQARNPDGTWGSGGISDKLLKLSELPKAPPHKADKHGRITEGKVHLYHSTNGLENLNNIVTNGINLDKQTAVQGLFFAKLGSPYRKHDSFVVLEMDINDVPWGNRFLDSEVAFGRIENYTIVQASKLSPDNMRTMKHFHRIFERDGIEGLEKSLGNYIRHEGKDNEVSKVVSSLISDEKNKKSNILINGKTKAGFREDQARGRGGKWTSGGSWHKIDIKEQVSSHKEFGGSTFDPRSGDSLAGSKGLGSVALFKERSVILDIDLTEEILSKYIEDNKDLLSLPDGRYSVGTWFGGEPKQLWLDVAFVTDIESAIKLGKEKNQVAIFDLEILEDVPTGGSGKSNVFVMEAKGAKKGKFDKYGKYLKAQGKKPKVMTYDEFMNGDKKKV